MRTSRSTSRFTRFASAVSRGSGSPAAFLVAGAIVLAWLVSGPFFGYSDTWQLVINTGTTIVTFLMVFLIHATQNRDAEAAQLKLDEIIRSLKGAHNVFVGLEDLEEDELLAIREEYVKLAERARHAARGGIDDTGVPSIQMPKGRK